MEILGVGPSELVLIVVLAIIVLGPRDMQKAGRTLGRWLRQVVTSDGWKFFQQTSREIQTLPNRLMRDAALEELRGMEQDLRQPLQGPGQRPAAVSVDPSKPNESAPVLEAGPEPRIRPDQPAPPSETDQHENA
ncbi:MAG TPA: twin-arginine translocase TatA/TatE family subunit [Anaerolineales bacterium]|nr:twin-arginine translocase TatA/TatE family subunit [Anaerolineales bacterium]